MLTQACQRCWHRKQKCDRISPECSACVAAGVKCLARVWGRVLDSDEVGASGSGSITQFQTRSPIEYLKQRIRYLENEEASPTTTAENESPTTRRPVSNITNRDQTHPHVESPRFSATTPQPLTSVSPGAASQNQPQSPSQSRNIPSNADAVTHHTNAFECVADVAVNEVEYLSLAAMSDGGGGKIDNNAAQDSILKHVMKSIVAIRGTSPSSDMTVVATDSTQTDSTPSLSEIEKEIKAVSKKDYRYLINVFTRTAPNLAGWQDSILSESVCMSALDTTLHSVSGAPPTSTVVSASASSSAPAIETMAESTATATAIALATSILALGGTASPFHATIQAPLLKLISWSRHVLPNIITTATGVTAIQCLILQTLLSLHYPSAGSAWHLLGLALTKAISAGLHRSNSSPAKSTSNALNQDETIYDKEEEEDKRSKIIFWTLYLLDRTLAVTIGRPLGLEDDDITLEAPETSMPLLPRQMDIPLLSKALFAWKVHHALLQSQWRRSGCFDLDVNLTSYEYWRTSYGELCERFKSKIDSYRNSENNDEDGHKFTIPLLQKDEAQLSCRALVHLLGQAVRQLRFDDSSLIPLKQRITEEIPDIINVIHDAIDSEHIAVTFLDGYDALAAAVTYIFCIYGPSQQQPSSSFRLGITQMRTITTSIDIIQRVAQQFSPIRGFKDVIWSLLRSLEAKAEGRSTDRLPKEIEKCEAPIPHHVRRLIVVCTQI